MRGSPGLRRGQLRLQGRGDGGAPGHVRRRARALSAQAGDARDREPIQHLPHRFGGAAAVRGDARRGPPAGGHQDHLDAVTLGGLQGRVVAGLWERDPLVGGHDASSSPKSLPQKPLLAWCK